MPEFIQSVRYALRQLRQSPEFTLLAVATLALGIGANTAMFTVVESVLLRPLPYKDANHVIYIDSGVTGAGALSWMDYRDIRDQAHSFSSVAAYSEDLAVVQGKDASVGAAMSLVTPNLFGILGAQPLLGRTFTKEEGEANGPEAVLLSEGLWRQTFHADRDMIGRGVRVNGHTRTVVGVMPRSFRFPESEEPDIERGLWLPMQPTPEMLQARGYHFLYILAKPAGAASLPRLQTELNAIAKRIRDKDSHLDRNFGFKARPYREIVVGSVRPVFTALLAALGLVLLIACANVANLLIARSLGRQHEFAVRAALGSGQRRLVGQMVVEAGLLSGFGCTLGFLLAYWLTAAIHRLPPGTIPRAEDIQVHWTVILVLAAIASLTTLLSALLPALFVARTDPQPILQASSRSVGTRSVRARVGGWLVAGEVALSVLLLVSTGLLFRTLWNLEHTRLGFSTTRLTSFTAMPADASGFGNIGVNASAENASSVATTVYRPLLEALRHAPGVQAAILATAPPLSGVDMNSSFRVVGWPDQIQHGFQARMTALSGGYERLMGTPVVRGRGITEEDSATAPFVAVINDAFARRYFAGKNPIGWQVNLGGKDTGMLKPYTIVGVLGDQIDAAVNQAPKPFLMLPYQQIPPSSLFYPVLLKTAVHFIVKTRSDIAVAPIARAVFRQVAPDLALDNFETMQQAVDKSNFSARLGLYVIASFAALAVLMVIAGLYGVLAQVVSYRRREFGVRMALGATRQSILGMVLVQGSAIVLLGLVAGSILAFSIGRLIQSFLFGVKPLDPATYVWAAITLLAVGAVAAFLPAWRAASLDPVNTLRDE